MVKNLLIWLFSASGSLIKKRIPEPSGWMKVCGWVLKKLGVMGIIIVLLIFGVVWVVADMTS